MKKKTKRNAFQKKIDIIQENIYKEAMEDIETETGTIDLGGIIWNMSGVMAVALADLLERIEKLEKKQ